MYYFSLAYNCAFLLGLISVYDKGQVSYGHPTDSVFFWKDSFPHFSASFVISRRASMSALFKTLYSVPCYRLSILAPVLHFLNYNFVVVVVQSLSHVWLFVTPWTIAHQASVSITISQSFKLCESVKVKSLSRIWFFVTPWTVAYQAPLSMRFSRQEYWSGLPFPSPGDLPTQGLNPGLLHWSQTL